jgi:hypothetical protein
MNDALRCDAPTAYSVWDSAAAPYDQTSVLPSLHELRANQFRFSRITKPGRQGERGSTTDAGLDYSVLDGFGVRLAFPWLVEYPYVSAPVGLYPVEARRFVNINMLAPGQSYEAHTDNTDLTAVVFLNTLEDSGALVLGRLDGTVYRAYPVRGKVVLIPPGVVHWVEAPSEIERYTLIYSFVKEPLAEVNYELNEYLYTPE